MKVLVAASGLFLLAALAKPASATDWISITDASQIKYQYQPSSNRVYLRNLHTFDSSFLACCYNYWIDTSTDSGKTMFTIFLSKTAASQSIDIGVVSKTTASAVNYVGTW